jgi:methionyl-tRNA formyltransferase
MHTVVREPLRVVFMGTPEFAVPSLRALVQHAAPARLWSSGLDIVGVLTRPDKPAGRGRHLAASPVKRYAAEQGIHVYQPGSLRTPEAQALLRSLAPDVIVVAAYGQILPKAVLDLPRHCCLNVHASLLPRWRGAAPVAAAILAGDAETGVTIMQMEEGLDTGPIVAQHALPIAAADTTGTLAAKLATLGADLLIDTLPQWLAGGASCQPQDEARATMTRPLRKDDGRLDWRRPAAELERQVRAYSPWPGAFTLWNGQIVKIARAHVADVPTDGRPSGTCWLASDAHGSPQLVCASGEGALALDQLQLEGRRPMLAAEALRGHPALAAATFSS